MQILKVFYCQTVMGSKTKRVLRKQISKTCGYKLISVNGKFSKPFKAYLCKDEIYNFMKNMIEGSKYCSDVMKKHFNKELVITKDDNNNFNDSTKCWVCDNDYVNKDVKVRDHCHVNGKYRRSVHRDCNVISIIN